MKNATRINSWENRCNILVKINTRATDSIVTIENPKLEESKHVPTAIDMTMKKAKMGDTGTQSSGFDWKLEIRRWDLNALMPSRVKPPASAGSPPWKHSSNPSNVLVVF
ncbi:hypothetical protein WG66_001678 [Moniliophthora roreri]|nr:hypothetical protein WG66_001678 [Moniliophthora roreri]